MSWAFLCVLSSSTAREKLLQEDVDCVVNVEDLRAFFNSIVLYFSIYSGCVSVLNNLDEVLYYPYNIVSSHQYDSRAATLYNSMVYLLK